MEYAKRRRDFHRLVSGTMKIEPLWDSFILSEYY